MSFYILTETCDGFKTYIGVAGSEQQILTAFNAYRQKALDLNWQVSAVWNASFNVKRRWQDKKLWICVSDASVIAIEEVDLETVKRARLAQERAEDIIRTPEWKCLRAGHESQLASVGISGRRVARGLK